MLGALLAVLTTVVVTVMLRLPSVVAAVGVVAWFFLLGPVFALRQLGLGLPAPESWRVLVDEALHGWKDLLTTLPPVDGESRLLVLPWLLGLVTGLLGAALIAVRSRRTVLVASLPVLPPLALLGVVILLGLTRPDSLWLQGMAFAVLALAWLGLRFARDAAPTRSAQGKLARLGAGAALVAVAGLLAMPVAPGRSATTRPRGAAHLRRPAVRRRAVPLPARVVPQVRQAPAGAKLPQNLYHPTLFTMTGSPPAPACESPRSTATTA